MSVGGGLFDIVDVRKRNVGGGVLAMPGRFPREIGQAHKMLTVLRFSNDSFIVTHRTAFGPDVRSGISSMT